MSLPTLARLALAAALVAGASSPAFAAASSGQPTMDSEADLSDLPIVSDEELDQNRGGFMWEGVDVNLGAEIRTYLNGALVLQTNISWTAAGANTTRFVSAALTPANAAQLQAGILSSGGISMHVGDQSVFLANGGQTAIFQPTDGAIQNILINRASNISARQEIDAVLDLGNFGQFQQRTGNSRIGDMIGEALDLGTLGALAH
jgi:hypothetical protein